MFCCGPLDRNGLGVPRIGPDSRPKQLDTFKSKSFNGKREVKELDTFLWNIESVIDPWRSTKNAKYEAGEGEMAKANRERERLCHHIPQPILTGWAAAKGGLRRLPLFV
ncbi:unnamed protein product [Prunus armeniaca]